MERLIVNPQRVYGFGEHLVGVSKNLCIKIEEEGWKHIPPVPCFKVPVDIPEREHDFMLLDGNHRKNVALYRGEDLPIVVYEPKEVIDIERDCLASSRNVTRHNRYRICLIAYTFRKERVARDLQRIPKEYQQLRM